MHALTQLDLRGMQHERVLPLDRFVDLDLRDAPAVVLKRAAKRRLARDVARQADP